MGHVSPQLPLFLEEYSWRRNIFIYLCIYCSLTIKFYCFIHVVPLQGTVVWARKVGRIPEETLEWLVSDEMESLPETGRFTEWFLARVWNIGNEFKLNSQENGNIFRSVTSHAHPDTLNNLENCRTTNKNAESM